MRENGTDSRRLLCTFRRNAISTEIDTRLKVDAAMERGMGRLLQLGVLLACAVVLLGGALTLLQHGRTVVDYRHFHREPGALRQPAALLHAVLALEPAAVVQLGVLLLIWTPVARVIFATASFLWQRDWRYAVISVVVLGVLLFGIFRAG